MVLEARSPKSRCWQTLLSLKTLGEDPSSPLSNSVVTDNLDFLWFTSHISQISASHVCLPGCCLCSTFPHLRRTLVIGLGFSLIQCGPNLIVSAKVILPTSSHSQVLGVQTCTYIFRETQFNPQQLIIINTDWNMKNMTNLENRGD